MDTEEIKSEVEGTFSEFLAILSSFEDDQFNEIPFEGSWTAGQLAKHVQLSVSGLSQALKGPVLDTERQPGVLVNKLREIFLDYSTRMQSPAFVAPRPGIYNRDELLQKIGEAGEQISDSVSTMDLSQTCTSFELPVLGSLTRLEAVYFAIYHTMRHTNQLQNIHQKLVEKPADVA